MELLFDLARFRGAFFWLGLALGVASEEWRKRRR